MIEYSKLQIGCMLIIIYIAFIYFRERYAYKVKKKEIVFGDLIIDEANYLVKCDEKSTLLSNKEMMILLLLANSNGKVVSLDTISKSAWEIESYSTNENVWVFISYLRKKLEFIGSKTKIKSIRYHGYYLEMTK